MKRVVKLEKESGFGAIFRPGVRRSTSLSTLLLCGVQSAGYSIPSWMPTLLIQTKHMSPQEVVATTIVVRVGAFFGYAGCAYICDRFGRRPCLIGFCLANGCLTAFYTMFPSSQWLFVALGFPIGFAMNGIFAAIGPYLSEQFPTNVRATGMGFTYNVGKAVGATTVTLVGITAGHTSLPYSIEIFCFLGYFLALVALLFMPETRGRHLDEPIVQESLVANTGRVPT